MFDIAATELLLIAVVAILVIGPKEMPTALRAVGRWIGKMRRISGHFRTGLDSMVREAEMEDMEKKWADQNEKIKAQYPDGGPSNMEQTGAFPATKLADSAAPGAADPAAAASAESASPGTGTPTTGTAEIAAPSAGEVAASTQAPAADTGKAD